MTRRRTDKELAAQHAQLLRERRQLQNRIGYLRRMGAAAAPAAVEDEPMDIAKIAGMALRRRAEGVLAADELWALAGKRRELAQLAGAKADLNVTISRLEADLGRLRSRLASLELDSGKVAAVLATLEHGLSTHTDDIRELMAMVPVAHLHNARIDEAKAKAALHASYEEARLELKVVNKEIGEAERDMSMIPANVDISERHVDGVDT